ncbi:MULTISPECIES: amino acid ABC transporter permease [Brucella/Ochrobactrum group]|uniref:amino acid ABC transporter permease n=1 Tax=Brucella/Ochrobactrum group TaxID=2826938 RepID=UPI001C04A9D5|nr:amino acid ABC transporter permease [Brucella sp. NBRC 12950]QWK81048.1 amino acid ABC transporter permease [Ochrobactrum sp. BTU1]GLU27485.1 amino acid ABC transporter permease [Brucella sp. NBRC 12950]
MAENVMTKELGPDKKMRPINDPKFRGQLFQIAVLICLVAAGYWVISNTITNLQRANIASGFGFLDGRAGFDISQALIPFSSDSTYGRALLVGFLNTLLVAATGIVAATILGFLIGIGRLSNNWLVAKLCTVYIEIFRNIPPLLIVFFWYVGVISVLPQIKQSIELPLSIFINNRGISFPKPDFGGSSSLVFSAFVIAILASITIGFFSRKRQVATGRRLPVLWTSIGLFLVLPTLTLLMSGGTLSFDLPELGRFRLQGGMTVGPEFLSLFLSLSFYTAAYIAEIVRSGIVGVSSGQTEAAHALGLSPSLTNRLVVVPQAMRIIIPPLTSQYLNLMKDSSLAIAVGYADIVSIGGTIMNQTGQAIEVITIWAIVFVSLSLSASGFMNWFNTKVALKER